MTGPIKIALVSAFDYAFRGSSQTFTEFPLLIGFDMFDYPPYQILGIHSFPPLSRP